MDRQSRPIQNRQRLGVPTGEEPVLRPNGQPNAKRENPTVISIGDYQVDLVKAAMLGYDIIFDANEEPLIAVLTSKSEGKLDEEKIKVAAALRNAAPPQEGRREED